MNTQLKTAVPTSAWSEYVMRDNLQENMVVEPMPLLDRTRVRCLEASEKINRTVKTGPLRTDRTLQGIAVVLGALVIVCIVLAGVVWWRLLT